MMNQTFGASQRPFIERLGNKFASRDVHHTICTIMTEHLTKPWITFRKVPQDVRRNMYNVFKTRWTLNSECDRSNFEAFINVLKQNYSDMMYRMRVKASERARIDGFDIAINDYKQFSIIHRYPPDSIPDGVWEQMCDIWDSKPWTEKAIIAKSNRDKGTEKDKAARHTGGSIGYDEYRIKMLLCREGSWVGNPILGKYFFIPISTNRQKKKLLAGELNLNCMEGMLFYNDRSKEAYGSYLEEMIERNGLEFDVDDPDVWTRVVEPNLKSTRRVYGIGSSDVNFLVTGKASSSSGVTQSHTQLLSQQKIHDLEVQIETERRARKELEEDMRKEREETQEMKQQMKELMKFMQRSNS